MGPSKTRRACRAARIALLPLALMLLAAPVLGGCYFLHVARGQLRLICSSVSLEEALASDSLSGCDKDKLRFIQSVRAFAETEIGLKKTDNYTTYYPGEKRPVTYVLTAAYRDRLEPVTWRFPVVGTVSYKGYFELEAAKEEAARLAADGYDVYLRPALAYSTLGWFKDPVLPLMLDLNEGELAMLVIHELAHGTVFAAGQTDFNESLAEFVGRQGAIDFLTRRYGPDNGQLAQLRAEIADGRLYDGFMLEAAGNLEELYESRPSDLTRARREFFDLLRADFERLRPGFQTDGYRAIQLRTLNNAFMVGHLAYADTGPFERAYESVHGDWTGFFELVRSAAAADDPLGKLRELVDR